MTRKNQQQEHPTLLIDRTVFKKSDQERIALKDLKRKVVQQMQAEHGDNWKKRFSKPEKLV